MDATLRTLQLLALLQQHAAPTSGQLARWLEVTPRTVRRDVTRLRELGYAVDSSPGRDGGYRLRAGSALPPLVLTDDEAVLVALGLRAAALTGLAGSTDLSLSTLAKLEGLLPERLRARVEAVAEAVVSLTADEDGGVDPSTLAVLALTCRREEYAAVGYVDAHGTATRRDVAPLRIVHAARRWYLVAFDLRRDGWRTFRIDRVTAAEPLGGRVRFDHPPDPAELVTDAITRAPYRWVATVRLFLSHDVAARRVPPTVARLTPETGGTTLLHLAGNELAWVARELVGLHCGFEVLEPPELVAALRDLGRVLVETNGEIGHSTSGPGG